MSDYETVRNDPAYPEKLDPEIIPLCDAMNGAGFTTTCSCWGHLSNTPKVWFDQPDVRAERFARFLLNKEFDFGPQGWVITKTIEKEGHVWCLEIKPTEIYMNTPEEEISAKTLAALAVTVELVGEFSKSENLWPN